MCLLKILKTHIYTCKTKLTLSSKQDLASFLCVGPLCGKRRAPRHPHPCLGHRALCLLAGGPCLSRSRHCPLLPKVARCRDPLACRGLGGLEDFSPCQFVACAGGCLDLLDKGPLVLAERTRVSGAATAICCSSSQSCPSLVVR